MKYSNGRDKVHSFDMRLIKMSEDEEVLVEIRKHPIGLVFIYVGGLLAAGAAFFVGMLLSVWTENTAEQSALTGENYSSIITIIAVIVTVLIVIGTFIAAFLYTSNIILVTNEKISQVIYRSLFSRKISQLNIGDVQDVTIDQHGILAHIFNYGTIVIETAGEQQNYTFTLSPDPYDNAKYIVSAQEENMKKHGN